MIDENPANEEEFTRSYVQNANEVVVNRVARWWFPKLLNNGSILHTAIAAASLRRRLSSLALLLLLQHQISHGRS